MWVGSSFVCMSFLKPDKQEFISQFGLDIQNLGYFKLWRLTRIDCPNEIAKLVNQKELAVKACDNLLDQSGDTNVFNIWETDG